MFGSNKAAPTRPASTIDTLIGAKTRIKGDISFSGGLRVDGSIEGSVVSDGGGDAVLTVTDQGSISGEVRAPHVIINGVMNGDIVATERVELAPQARVVGNVYYKVLEMAAGAQITGRVVREDEPRKQLPKPEAKPDGKPEQGDLVGDGESRMQVKTEPKDRSRVDAKRNP